MYALMGLLGFKEVLDRITKLEEGHREILERIVKRGCLGLMRS